MDKKEALENALKQIEKDFGKGSIMRLGEATANMNVEVIPTGILPLDVALGVGGLPRGRIIAALVPKEEIEGDMGASHVGLQARLMSQAMRKLTGFISKSRAVTVFINQIREKVGVTYGSPEVTTGGRALKFYSTIRIDVRKGEALKQGTESIGNHTKVRIVKNKVAPPFKMCEFDIMYGEGVSREGCVIDMAADLDIMNKSGSWYSYNGNRLGQGRETVKELLRQQPAMYEEVSAKILERLKEKQAEEEKKADAKLAAATAKAEKAAAGKAEPVKNEKDKA